MSKLADVVAEMRALGVTEYHAGSMRVVLGPEPPKPVTPPKPPTKGEKIAEFKRVKQYRERMLYAATEGFDDAEEPDDYLEEPGGLPVPLSKVETATQ